MCPETARCAGRSQQARSAGYACGGEASYASAGDNQVRQARDNQLHRARPAKPAVLHKAASETPSPGPGPPGLASPGFAPVGRRPTGLTSPTPTRLTPTRLTPTGSARPTSPARLIRPPPTAGGRELHDRRRSGSISDRQFTHARVGDPQRPQSRARGCQLRTSRRAFDRNNCSTRTSESCAEPSKATQRRHRAGSDHVRRDLPGQILRPPANDLSVIQPKVAHDIDKEFHSALHWLDQRYLTGWQHDRQHDARKPGARADIGN